MGKPVIRITDLYTNPLMQGATAPVAAPGSTSLFVSNLPVVQLTDAITPIPDMALPNTNTVFHNGTPLNAMGDQTSQAGVFVLGAPTVLIG